MEDKLSIKSSLKFYSLQASSSAMEPKIWFGVNDAEPQIMASQAAQHGIEVSESNRVVGGWVPFVKQRCRD